MSGGEALGPYPCPLDVSVAGVHGTVYTFPEGDREVVLHDAPRPRVKRSPDEVPELETPKIVGLDAGIPEGCPLPWVDLVDCFGEVTARMVERRICPFLHLLDRVTNETRACARAKVKFRRLVRANGLRYMTTLTVPESGPRGRRDLYRLWRGFLMTDDGKALFSGGWAAVIEAHKKRGYHLHILHAERFDAVYVRALWTKYLCVTKGYTLPEGTSSVRTHEKDWGSARMAVKYASKYVTKAFGLTSDERGLGGHRYLRSLNLVEIGEKVQFPTWEDALAWCDSLPRMRRFTSDMARDACCIRWLWGAWEPLPSQGACGVLDPPCIGSYVRSTATTEGVYRENLRHDRGDGA